MQMIITFNSFTDTACRKFTFKFLYNIATDCFQSHPLLGRKQYNFDQENDCCISQGSVMTFLICGRQMQNHLCQICSGFRVPSIEAYTQISDSQSSVDESCTNMLCTRVRICFLFLCVCQSLNIIVHCALLCIVYLPCFFSLYHKCV